MEPIFDVATGTLLRAFLIGLLTISCQHVSSPAVDDTENDNPEDTSVNNSSSDTSDGDMETDSPEPQDSGTGETGTDTSGEDSGEDTGIPVDTGVDTEPPLPMDLDSDGWYAPLDCDDASPLINPSAEEIPNNGVDEDCDGWDTVPDRDTDTNPCLSANPPPECSKYSYHCGDGILDEMWWEECDDGNLKPGDGCSGLCQNEGCWTDSDSLQPEWHDVCDCHNSDACGSGLICGDGILDPGTEECDDGVLSGQYGTCAPGCTYGPYCGDGIHDADYEDCDLGPENGEDSICDDFCMLNVLVP